LVKELEAYTLNVTLPIVLPFGALLTTVNSDLLVFQCLLDLRQLLSWLMPQEP